MLRAEGVIRRSTVQSFDWRSLQAVEALAPEIGIVCLTAEQPWLDTIDRGQPGPSPWTGGFDIDEFGGDVPALAAAASCDVWSPYVGDLDEAGLRSAHRRDLRVVVWTVNDPAEMARLIALRVDGIITDYPDRLRAVMEGARPRPAGADPGRAREGTATWPSDWSHEVAARRPLRRSGGSATFAAVARPLPSARHASPPPARRPLP